MICIVLVSVSILPVVSCSTKALPAFSHGHVKYFGNNYLLQSSSSCLMRRTQSLPQFRPSDVSYTKLYASREKAQSTAAGSIGLDEKEVISYPVQVNHQGHIATISVREGEPILQALERQSTLSNKSKNDESAKTEQKDGNSSLALSQIPHECRRGNCLTCSSRIVESNSSGNDATQNMPISRFKIYTYLFRSPSKLGTHPSAPQIGKVLVFWLVVLRAFFQIDCLVDFLCSLGFWIQFNLVQIMLQFYKFCIK